MKKKDVFPGIVLLVFSIIYYTLARLNLEGRGKIEILDPTFYPYILAYLLAGLSLALIIQGFWKGSTESVEESQENTNATTNILGRSIPNNVLVMFYGLLYIFFLGKTGYLIATPLFLLASLLTMGMKKFKTVIGVVIGGTVLLYLMFAVGLNVLLP